MKDLWFRFEKRECVCLCAREPVSQFYRLLWVLEVVSLVGEGLSLASEALSLASETPSVASEALSLASETLSLSGESLSALAEKPSKDAGEIRVGGAASATEPLSD
jgi:hypothetical protein